jgi:O-acetyl-ADP-ribose deacetylase (regulator of RNase III)
MPLKIIRQDITKIKCDAIVNPTNRRLKADGGADKAIHAAAGPYLARVCDDIGPISVGEAVITPAFNLPCKYVIHTVGPVWRGGKKGEREAEERRCP